MTLDEARDHIGHGVVYDDGGGRWLEQGVITAVNDAFVFVRYGSDQGSKATPAAALTLLWRADTDGAP